MLEITIISLFSFIERTYKIYITVYYFDLILIRLHFNLSYYVIHTYLPCTMVYRFDTVLWLDIKHAAVDYKKGDACVA